MHEEIHQVWKHNETHNLYWVYRGANMKVNGEWTPCYFYYSKEGLHYAREEKDFENKFTLLH